MTPESSTRSWSLLIPAIAGGVGAVGAFLGHLPVLGAVMLAVCVGFLVALLRARP